MNFKNYLIAALMIASLTSCVSVSKYSALENKARTNELAAFNANMDLEKMKIDLKNQSNNYDNQISVLKAEIEFLKSNSNKALNIMQEMSILSSTQAESIQKSMSELSKKSNYIMNLQSAIAKKDSMNIALVMNLKGAIGDINDKDINIKVEKGVVFIDISDKLLFNSGKYYVTKQAKVILEKIAKVLNAHPEIEFMVEGHTDNNPMHNGCIDDNWDLSVKRATSVIRILEKEYKINPVRMTAAGHSQYIPVVSNDTKEGKALNRRTRIIILPQLDQFFKLLIKQ